MIRRNNYVHRPIYMHTHSIDRFTMVIGYKVIVIGRSNIV